MDPETTNLIDQYIGPCVINEHSKLNTSWVFSIVPQGTDYSLGIKAHTILIPEGVSTVGALRFEVLNDKHKFSKGHYFLFRKGIEPTFECKDNVHGGRWNFRFPNLQALTDGWITLAASAAGETLFREESVQDDVAGVQLLYNKMSVRVWMKTTPEKTIWDPFLLTPQTTLIPQIVIEWQPNQVHTPQRPLAPQQRLAGQRLPPWNKASRKSVHVKRARQ